MAWQNQYAFPKVLIEHLIFKNNSIFLFFPKIKRSQKTEEEKAVDHMLPFPSEIFTSDYLSQLGHLGTHSASNQ